MHLLSTFIHYFYIDIKTSPEFYLNNEAANDVGKGGGLECRRGFAGAFPCLQIIKKAGSTVNF